MIVQKMLSAWKWVAAAAMPIAGFAIAMALRSPKTKMQKIEVEEPDMKLADENVEKLVERQEETKQQHKEIQEVLTLNSVEPTKDIHSAVKTWNTKD